MKEPNWLRHLKSEENLRRLRAQALPLNLQELVDQGVLRERGSWYDILDHTRVPEHAWLKVSGIEFGGQGSLQFSNQKQVAETSRMLYQQLTGQNPEAPA